MEPGAFLLSLIVIWVAAKLFGELAERFGQPAVLGEMVGGVVVGVSGLHLIDAHEPTLHLLSELGVILLLFLIGLETNIHSLLKVGVAAFAVAVIGVLLPFGGGYAAGLSLGYSTIVSIFLGAALTATSVGITARVLSDLGNLDTPESQVILGAAVVDDIIGLVLLAIVGTLARGGQITAGGVSKLVAVAFGFVVVAIVAGSIFAPWLVRAVGRLRVAKALLFSSLILAFGLAYAADAAGSAMIIGAFAAGVVLARTDKGHQIEREVHDIAQFFIPIFFVMVGAAVDLRTLNPMTADGRRYIMIGLVLAVIGVLGKIAAGWGARGKGLRKIVIGVGMVPRGEVGLIFANIGLTTGLLTRGLYSSVTLLVMVTTFVGPPMLRALVTPKPRQEIPPIAAHVSEAMTDE
jgi:Kef-type K+ transport system membrane component KefB